MSTRVNSAAIKNNWSKGGEAVFLFPTGCDKIPIMFRVPCSILQARKFCVEPPQGGGLRYDDELPEITFPHPKFTNWQENRVPSRALIRPPAPAQKKSQEEIWNRERVCRSQLRKDEKTFSKANQAPFVFKLFASLVLCLYLAFDSFKFRVSECLCLLWDGTRGIWMGNGMVVLVCPLLFLSSYSFGSQKRLGRPMLGSSTR